MFDLKILAEVGPQPVVERESIRFLGLGKVTEAEDPVVTIVFNGEAHGVAARVGGVVRSAARHECPVEKLVRPSCARALLSNMSMTAICPTVTTKRREDTCPLN